MKLRFSGLVRCSLVTLAFALRASAATWPLPTTSPASAGFSAARLELLQRNLKQTVEEGKYSGYVTLIARDGKIADWKSGGWADVEAKKPMQPDTIVRIYSMSKIITTVAVLTLLEDGKLKLTDEVEKYLPVLRDRMVCTGGTLEAPVLVPAKRAVTILDLLTHTSGYCYDAAWSAEAPVLQIYQRAGLWQARSLDDFVLRVATLPLHNQPGERFRYGISVDLLGAIVEKISGETLDDYLHEHLFDPLDLRDTGFAVPEEKKARLARIYLRANAGGLELDPVRNRSLVGPGQTLFSGGGGLYSTAADYARFAQMLLNGGELDGVRILSPKSVELMRQDRLVGLADPHPFGAKSQGFGLGVRILTDLGRSPTLGSLGCFGWDGAATTLVQIDPKERTVALLLMQHGTFNQDDIFATFINGYYAAMTRE
jgi:CubicO group peptidase (beta-lactamase class C family)